MPLPAEESAPYPALNPASCHKPEAFALSEENTGAFGLPPGFLGVLWRLIKTGEGSFIANLTNGVPTQSLWDLANLANQYGPKA